MTISASAVLDDNLCVHEPMQEPLEQQGSAVRRERARTTAASLTVQHLAPGHLEVTSYSTPGGWRVLNNPRDQIDTRAGGSRAVAQAATETSGC